MNTSFDELYHLFFEKIESDADFFDYCGLDDNETACLIHQRAKTYLTEAVSKFVLLCDLTTSDFRIDFSNETFGQELTYFEKDLIANLMLEMHLKRDIPRAKIFAVNFAPSDLKVFSPAEDRKTFMAMYEEVCQKNLEMIDLYVGKDRNTLASLSIDYASYGEE